jgi:hypothetical protein
MVADEGRRGRPTVDHDGHQVGQYRRTAVMAWLAAQEEATRVGTVEVDRFE